MCQAKLNQYITYGCRQMCCRCLDVGSIPTGSINKYGRLPRGLRGCVRKRSRRVKACVGSESHVFRFVTKRSLVTFLLEDKMSEENRFTHLFF